MKISKLVPKGDEKKVSDTTTTTTTTQLPPAYSEATKEDRYNDNVTSSSSNITGPRPILTRPTNYLTLVRENFPIRGTYRVDPTLPIPPGAIISKGGDGKELNLKFNSTNGSIDVCLDIIRGPAPGTCGPARLELKSISCDVTATILDKHQNRFRLRAISHQGNVTVNIPQTFTGSVVAKLNKGTIKFGTEIHSQLAVLSEQNNESRYFIGDYLTTAYRDDESWPMDYLYVESQTGTISINFVKESSTRKEQPPVRRKESKSLVPVGKALLADYFIEVVVSLHEIEERHTKRKKAILFMNNGSKIHEISRMA
ncbi:hypothetical protein Clacol_004498 [Clathrus columnatus]|uniref:DUF7330 domain-containing protein n=1 Tax=Clathrus columnatus TaxID=1419009 RepID=A0AAV5A9M7_9AGAM|nr:hypothetical protein Clacol_004498 [Clathrus columnatus]